jgi:hypothetical protein
MENFKKISLVGALFFASYGMASDQNAQEWPQESNDNYMYSMVKEEIPADQYKGEISIEPEIIEKQHIFNSGKTRIQITRQRLENGNVQKIIETWTTANPRYFTLKNAAIAAGIAAAGTAGALAYQNQDLIKNYFSGSSSSNDMASASDEMAAQPVEGQGLSPESKAEQNFHADHGQQDTVVALIEANDQPRKKTWSEFGQALVENAGEQFNNLRKSNPGSLSEAWQNLKNNLREDIPYAKDKLSEVGKGLYDPNVRLSLNDEERAELAAIEAEKVAAQEAQSEAGRQNAERLSKLYADTRSYIKDTPLYNKFFSPAAPAAANDQTTDVA